MLAEYVGQRRRPGDSWRHLPATKSTTEAHRVADFTFVVVVESYDLHLMYRLGIDATFGRLAVTRMDTSSSIERSRRFYRLPRSRIRRNNPPCAAGVVIVAPPSWDDGDTFRYSQLEYGTLLPG